MDGQRIGVLEYGVPVEERTGRTKQMANVNGAALASAEGEDEEEPSIRVTLTHFVQGRSPLNPFPEARPPRKVPDNLHSETTGRVIHHATLLSVGAAATYSTETSSN